MDAILLKPQQPNHSSAGVLGVDTPDQSAVSKVALNQYTITHRLDAGGSRSLFSAQSDASQLGDKTSFQNDSSSVISSTKNEHQRKLEELEGQHKAIGMHSFYLAEILSKSAAASILFSGIQNDEHQAKKSTPIHHQTSSDKRSPAKTREGTTSQQPPPKQQQQRPVVTGYQQLSRRAHSPAVYEGLSSRGRIQINVQDKEQIAVLTEDINYHRTSTSNMSSPPFSMSSTSAGSLVYPRLQQQSSSQLELPSKSLQLNTPPSSTIVAKKSLAILEAAVNCQLLLTSHKSKLDAAGSSLSKMSPSHLTPLRTTLPSDSLNNSVFGEASFAVKSSHKDYPSFLEEEATESSYDPCRFIEGNNNYLSRQSNILASPVDITRDCHSQRTKPPSSSEKHTPPRVSYLQQHQYAKCFPKQTASYTLSAADSQCSHKTISSESNSFTLHNPPVRNAVVASWMPARRGSAGNLRGDHSQLSSKPSSNNILRVLLEKQPTVIKYLEKQHSYKPSPLPRTMSPPPLFSPFNHYSSNQESFILQTQQNTIDHSNSDTTSRRRVQSTNRKEGIEGRRINQSESLSSHSSSDAADNQYLVMKVKKIEAEQQDLQRKNSVLEQYKQLLKREISTLSPLLTAAPLPHSQHIPVYQLPSPHLLTSSRKIAARANSKHTPTLAKTKAVARHYLQQQTVVQKSPGSPHPESPLIGQYPLEIIRAPTPNKRSKDSRQLVSSLEGKQVQHPNQSSPKAAIPRIFAVNLQEKAVKCSPFENSKAKLLQNTSQKGYTPCLSFRLISENKRNPSQGRRTTPSKAIDAVTAGQINHSEALRIAREEFIDRCQKRRSPVQFQQANPSLETQNTKLCQVVTPIETPNISAFSTVTTSPPQGSRPSLTVVSHDKHTDSHAAPLEPRRIAISLKGHQLKNIPPAPSSPSSHHSVLLESHILKGLMSSQKRELQEPEGDSWQDNAQFKAWRQREEEGAGPMDQAENDKSNSENEHFSTSLVNKNQLLKRGKADYFVEVSSFGEIKQQMQSRPNTSSNNQPLLLTNKYESDSSTDQLLSEDSLRQRSFE